MDMTRVELRCVFSSGNDNQILSALRQMRESLSNDEPSWYFDLAREQVGSCNNDVRWQSIIVIGEYIPFGKRNDEIWDILIEFGGRDDDMQDALATVLLEHLLEYDFERSVDRITLTLQACSSASADILVDLLRRCWPFGQAERKWQKVQEIIKHWLDERP